MCKVIRLGWKGALERVYDRLDRPTHLELT